MFGKDKRDAFHALNKDSEALNSEWKQWEYAPNEAYRKHKTEKQAAREERLVKKAAWEERTRANISRLEDRLDRLKDFLTRKYDNLSKLEEKRDSAWSDDYKERIDGWISEVKTKLS